MGLPEAASRSTSSSPSSGSPRRSNVQPRHQGRAPDHLRDLGRPRPADREDAAALDEQVAEPLRQLRAAAEEVRPQRGDDPDLAGQDHGAQRLAELGALGGGDGLVENLLELVADHDELRQALGISDRIDARPAVP